MIAVERVQLYLNRLRALLMVIFIGFSIFYHLTKSMKRAMCIAYSNCKVVSIYHHILNLTSRICPRNGIAFGLNIQRT